MNFFLLPYNKLASRAIKNHYAVTLFILFGLGLVLVLAYYTIFSPVAATMDTQACTGLYAESNHREGYREVKAISNQRLQIRGQDEKDGPMWSAEALMSDEKNGWFSIVSTKQKPALKAFECACHAEGLLWRKVGEKQVVNIWKKVDP